jgi:hypothetical protein
MKTTPKGERTFRRALRIRCNDPEFPVFYYQPEMKPEEMKAYLRRMHPGSLQGKRLSHDFVRGTFRRKYKDWLDGPGELKLIAWPIVAIPAREWRKGDSLVSFVSMSHTRITSIHTLPDGHIRIRGTVFRRGKRIGRKTETYTPGRRIYLDRKVRD